MHPFDDVKKSIQDGRLADRAMSDGGVAVGAGSEATPAEPDAAGLRKWALILLGPGDEYLGVFDFYADDDSLDRDVNALLPLMAANSEGRLPLRERLRLAPAYFPFAGRVQGFEVEDLADPMTPLRGRRVDARSLPYEGESGDDSKA